MGCCGVVAWPPEPPAPTGELVAVVCAGTSDLPVAREAELTARYLGRPTRLVVDVGVAGLHRLVRHLPEIREAGHASGATDTRSERARGG